MLANRESAPSERLDDQFIVPAVAWSTSLFPIAQAGLVPVVVDVDPATLNLDVDAALAAMGPRTRAVLAVHLLGCPSPLRRLRDAGLLVLEDACGAHGAVVEGRRAGGHGLASSFSFFFSHHLTTIEGGMVLTSDDALADALTPAEWDGAIKAEADRSLADFVERHGRKELIRIIRAGQHAHPRSLTYHGRGPTWSRLGRWG